MIILQKLPFYRELFSCPPKSSMIDSKKIREYFMHIKSLFCLFFVINLFALPGKSFLSLRPHFEAGTTERFNLDHLLQKDDEKRQSFAIVPFGGISTNAQNLADYFLPTHNNCLIIGEDNAVSSRDINANYLGIISVPLLNKTGTEILNLIEEMTYLSNLSLCPKIKEFGIGALYRYQIPDICWFDISTAVIHVRHELNPCEQILNNGGTGPNGFGYPNLASSMNCATFGKITNYAPTETGFPQVELRVGKTSYHKGRILTGFIGVDIPKGNKPCQRYMFEPIVGNNKHVGLFLGIQGTQNLNATELTRLSLSCDLLLRYLCPNTQLRSFDLKFRPWSRYMWIWKNNDAFGNPNAATNVTEALNRIDYLINYSTLCVNVSPNIHFDAQVNLTINKNNWHAELGYHFYASQKENLSFESCFTDNLGISAIAHYLQRWATNATTPVTRSFNPIDGSTFAAQPDVVDYDYNAAEGIYNTQYCTITRCDLDLESAATPTQMIHTLYGSLGYTLQQNNPVIFSLGTSYDFSANNHAPNQWLIWLQLGIRF